MIKYTVHVEGMACPKCEAHVNEAVKKAFTPKSVLSSHVEKRTEILAGKALSEDAIRGVIEGAGYKVGKITAEETKKTSFSLFHK